MTVAHDRAAGHAGRRAMALLCAAVHITVNANGFLTASVDKLEFFCQSGGAT